jgi:cyclophilin family peptidyl-prolyl cis-trans isomerase
MKPLPLFSSVLSLCAFTLTSTFAQAAPPAAKAEGPADVLAPSKPDGIRTTTLRGADASLPLIAVIETTKGVIEVELDFRHAPLTVMNFVGLAEGTLPFEGRPPGSKFYDGIAFHRVVKGFVAQCGDPLSADPTVPIDKLGEGGPGYSFPDEFDPRLRHDAAGVVQMANAGPDTNGSQFCIMLNPANRLNYLHNVFGQVVRGMDAVYRIERGDRILHIAIKRLAPEPGADAANGKTSGVAEEQTAAAYQATPEAFKALKKKVLARRGPGAAAGFVYLVDETGRLPEFRVNNFNCKLANYERASGHRLVVRLMAEFNPEPSDQSVDGAVKNHAESLQLPDDGDNALVVYYAKPKGGWSMRLGEKIYPALMKETGSAEQLTTDGALHRRQAELLAEAQALSKEGKIKESVDAVIDTLIKTLDDFALQQMLPEKR